MFKKPTLVQAKVVSFSIRDTRIHLTDLVDRAYMLKEETIITKSGKPRAKIVALNEADFKKITASKSIKVDN